METLITGSITEAAAIIKRGGIVAFPTETVYGLGADAFNADAIGKVFEAKGRPADNPLIVHICDLGQLKDLVPTIPVVAEKLIDAFFPGPLTLIMKRLPSVPDIATAGLDTVAVRMPANNVANSLIRAAGVPLVAPSANLSGKPSPTTWQAVKEDMDGKIDAILIGDPSNIGLESTVVDVSEDPPILLRKGAVTIDQLCEIVPHIAIISDDKLRQKRSPGTRHRHYSPNAQVLIVSATEKMPSGIDAYIGVDDPAFEVDYIVICKDLNDYAARLFEFFRECDRRGYDLIGCQPVPAFGVGVAIMDRLQRATE